MVSLARQPYLCDRLQEFGGASVFAEMSELAVRTASINLGQGFPDVDGPDAVAEAAIDAIRAGYNQYPPGIGHAVLRQAVAEHQKRFWNLDFDADDEILITAGATEAITASLLALTGPGDEVVMFEPYFDIYPAVASLAGARRRVVTLRPPAFDFDPDQLAGAFNANTKVMLLNSPHNPTGRVFTVEELDMIAELCVEHDVIAVTDEVYEHLVFDDHRHVPLCSRPAMADRTVTISSCGKTLSFTGWKIGWVCARAPLVRAVQAAKQLLTYVSGGPFQPAVAVGLQLPDAYFESLSSSLQQRRDLLCTGLSAAGLAPSVAQGTYYVTADIRSLGEHDGVRFCRSLPHRCAVVAVPVQVLCDDKEMGAPLVRFAACKQPAVLQEAMDRLACLSR